LFFIVLKVSAGYIGLGHFLGSLLVAEFYKF
jgi:hypothetical protein